MIGVEILQLAAVFVAEAVFILPVAFRFWRWLLG